MYIKPLTFVYIQPIHNNFAQLFVSKNEGDLHWTIWNLTPPKLGALTGLQLVTIWNLPGWLIWNSFSDSPRKLGPPHTVKYISEYKKYLTGHQASECIRYQGTKSSADTNYSSSIQKSRSGFFHMRKRKISSKLRLWFLHGLYFSPIRTHPYQDEVGRQWLCIEITINSSLGFSILLHGFLLLCHMLHRFNIPAFRLVVYHHLSGLSFTMPCSCYILTCSNPGIFAQELQSKA